MLFLKHLYDHLIVIKLQYATIKFQHELLNNKVILFRKHLIIKGKVYFYLIHHQFIKKNPNNLQLSL